MAAPVELAAHLGVYGHMHSSLLHDGSLLSMKVNGQAGRSHSPSSGLRQSCPLSTTLIGIFFHGLHHLQLMPAPAGPQFRRVQICKLISMRACSGCLLCYSAHDNQRGKDTRGGGVQAVCQVPCPVAPVSICDGRPMQHVDIDSLRYLELQFHSADSMCFTKTQ